MSTALNSNAINIVAGLLLPTAVTGLGRPSSHQALLITVWNAAMTVLVLASAYWNRGLGRPVGVLVIVVYVWFAAVVLLSEYAVSVDPRPPHGWSSAARRAKEPQGQAQHARR